MNNRANCPHETTRLDSSFELGSAHLFKLCNDCGHVLEQVDVIETGDQYQIARLWKVMKRVRDLQMIHISVNGRSQKTQKSELSYDEIVKLAGGEHGDTITYYVFRVDSPKGGTVVPGGSVILADGMHFAVVNTGAA